MTEKKRPDPVEKRPRTKMLMETFARVPTDSESVDAPKLKVHRSDEWTLKMSA